MEFENKPSKLHRVSNMRHSKYNHQANSRFLSPKSLGNGFNFKKTNAKKYKYSCGGYGGRCPMCKRCYK